MKKIVIVSIALLMVCNLFAQKDTEICRPQSSTYWTGRIDSWGKYDGEIKVGTATANVFRGWAKFDISSIPSYATIESCTLKFWVNEATTDNHILIVTRVWSDPVYLPYSDLKYQILNGTWYAQDPQTYNIALSTGYKYATLNNSAELELQYNVNNGINWFAVGFYELGEDAYRFHIDGWDWNGGVSPEPMLIVEYFTPAYLDITGCPSQNVSHNSGSFNLNVSSNVSWSVSDNADWVTCNPTSGSGNGNVSVNYGQNTSTSSRTCTVTVSGSGITKTCTFTQNGAPAYLDITGCPSQYVSHNSGNFNLNVSSNVSWSVSDNADWVTCNPTSGSGNGNVSVNYGQNTSTSSRTCTVTVSGSGITKTCTFTQNGAPAYLDITGCPSQYVSHNSGNFNLNVSSNVSWSVSDNAVWVTCNPTSGNGDGIVTVDYEQNTSSSPRTCTVTVTGGGITKTCTFTQDETTGLNNKNRKELFSIYPNPAKNKIYIKITNSELFVEKLELLNMIGKAVYQSEKNKMENLIEIPVVNFNPGVYFVKLHTSEGIITKKIIIQH